nr:MAG: hypothetical protein 3 [Leviviridae sp.]
MKSLTSLWSCTANELAVRCHTSAARDITTVTSRVEHEGLWFLAVTLADFGKSAQSWLNQGFVDPSDVPSFKRAAGRRNGLPAFLGGFLDRVFDASSGVLLDDPDIEAIYAVRQLTLMFSKIALPMPTSDGRQTFKGRPRVVSEGRERLAMDGYIQCEKELKESDARLDPAYLEDLVRMSNLLYGELFSKVDREVSFGRLIPKHGPGAVADRLTTNGKFNQRSWPARLQRMFPAEEFIISNLKRSDDQSRPRDTLDDELELLEPGAEMPVRVITVPKTLKTPRIIAIEPTAMQYTQQALLRGFLDAIHEDSFLNRVIGTTDQEPNRRMAREGSLSGELATLDLSEASDRVSNQHVRAIMSDWPHLREAVQACRSQKADVPGHGVIRLAKFASMGSALCFPIEEMVFLAIIFLGIERELSAPLSREELIKRFSGKVRVFGDDLIVPVDYVLSVVDELENFGFRVNVGKSYWTGRFRESCGKEYFDGHDVSIVKVREVLPTRRQNASGVISATALRNLAYWSGLWKTAAWLDNYMAKLLKGAWPVVSKSSPLLGRESVLGYHFETLDKHTHSPLATGYHMRSIPPSDQLDGDGALLKCLLRGSQRKISFLEEERILKRLAVSAASNDEEHLERTGRPERVDIKLGRRCPY